MDDFEILTDSELKAKPARSTALDEQDLAGLDAEVAARDNALKASLRQSVMVNPDEAARSATISKLTGVPVDVVDRNKEDVEANARMQQLRGVLAESPILTRQMSDPAFAKLAHDDAENLSLFEKTLRTYLGASVKSGIESLLGTGARVLDAVQPFTLSEQDAAVLFKDKPEQLKEMQEGPTMFLTRFARAMQQASEATMANINPDARATYGGMEYATLDPNKAAYLSPIKVVGDAIQSLPTTLALAVSAYLTKGVATRVEAEAIASGMSQELARKAAIHAASETMAKLGAVTEGAAGFGQQAIQTREQADKISDATLAQSQAYKDLIAAGFSHEAARLALGAQTASVAGAAGGAADAITNYFGGKLLGRIIGEGGALLKRVAKGFGTEAATEAVQSGLEQLGQNAAIQNFMNPHQELLDGVAEQIAQGFVVGGVMGGSFAAAAGRRGQAELAQRDTETLKKLFELSASDKLRERSPEEFAKFVQAAADEHGSSAVYVDAATFAQAAQEKGLDVAATMPETAAQMEEAIALKGDLRIPLGELTSALPGTGLENTLLQHMRMAPEAPTLKETQDKQFVEETQAAVAKAMEEHEVGTAQQQSAKVVETELLRQLSEANRFTKDVNGAYARLMSAFYTVQSARLGITPEQMFAKYPLRIQAEAATGENVLGKNAQLQQAEIKSPAFKTWFKKSKVTEKGKPLVVYHGSGAAISKFDYKYTDQGNDQLGSGFYFTTQESEAESYTTRTLPGETEKLGGMNEPSVHPVYLSIQKPLDADALGNITPKQVREIIELAPDFDTHLENWGDVNYEGMQAVMAKAAAAYAIQRSNVLQALHKLANDFFPNEVERFNRAVQMVLGYDGVVSKIDESKTHWVAWFPEQIKSIDNSGAFDPKSGNIYSQDIDNETGKVIEGPPAPPFYSALAMQIASAKMNVAPAAQWKAFINGLSSKGVKKDEMTLSGVMDWLDTREETWETKTAEPGGMKLVTYASSSEVEAQSILATEKEMGRVGEIVKKSDTRVSKQEVLDYLATSGVQVETKILGAPAAEQSTAVTNPNEFPAGFTFELTRSGYEVTAPDGAVNRRLNGREEAVAWARQYNETMRQDESEEDEITDDEVEERARKLWEEDSDQRFERALEYARDSDWSKYDIALVLPNYRIVELPADLLREKAQFAIKRISYGTLTNVDDIADLEEPTETYLQLHFATEAEAREWATANMEQAPGSDGPIDADAEEPHFMGHFGEADIDTDEHETREEAEKDADTMAQGMIESDAQSSFENDSFDDDRSHYEELARRELEEERGPRGWRTARTSVPKDTTLALQHKGQYQSKGGSNYRELVIGVPSIEPYNATDRIHFGHVFNGRTVAWARVKEHTDAAGDKVLFIEEIQSQRAQHGREQGFKSDEKQARFNEITEEMDRPAEVRNPVTNAIAEEARWHELARERDAVREESGPVPAAPFVTETQAWTSLTLKRLIRYAVDQGLSRVAWTPGVQQVDRYENALRKSVDAIQWKKVEGGIEINASNQGVSKVEQKFGEKELQAAIGPTMAQQIINSADQEGLITGRDIKIDDLGMVNFYGDGEGRNVDGKPAVMTIVANKILKSLGGGAVRATEIPGLKEIDTSDENYPDYKSAPGFEITDKMRDVVKKGLPLFQPDKWAQEMEAAMGGSTTQGKNARGQIAFGSNIQETPSVITLLQNADLSTFLHESGHFYLEVMSDIASQPNAPAEVMGDMQHVLNWFGVPDLATWQGMTLEEKRPFHEQFARGFESYLFSGKAPSTELAGLFARFRAWLINVYKQITALNVSLTPEVQGVLDRMLATNDEIVQAEIARGYAPLFKSAEEMGATAEEWRNYQELGMAATQEAAELLQTRSLRDMKWLSNAKSKVLAKLQRDAKGKRKAVEAEVTDEVRQVPVYAAIRFLTHGELAEEDRSNRERKALEAIAGQPNKLSISDLKAMYGDGPAAPWRYLNTGKFGHLAAEDGLNPQMVAELFGFTSGDHLVREILAAEPEESVIEGMTDKRMLERYGDLSSPEAIEKAANEAVHNEARGRFLATEVQALTKAAGQRKILIPAAKEFAATLIARKRVREIRPSQYVAAETRAARAAERAKSLVEKATEKRNQLVNHYAARAALDALAEVEKAVGYLRRVGESKSVDVSYREQIQALLARFELREMSNKDAARKASLLQWAEEQRAQGFEPVIDEDLLNEAKRMPYREMPLEEFRGLVDAVKNIEHLGRLKHRLLTLADQREFAAISQEAADAIEANAKRTIKAPLERTKWVKIKSGVAEFFALHRKFAMMMREMDGHQDKGVLWKLFVRPMNAAGDTESVMREAATKKLQALLAPVLKEGKMAQKRYIPEINASLSREGRIVVALNMGNAGNLQRLLDGDNWTLDQARAILNTLTKTEMDFVQGVWDYVGSFRDEIGQQQRRITGVAPEWVEAHPVLTVHGEYRGGYIPAKYDTSRSTRSLSDEAAQGVMDMWRAKRGAAKTRDSFTKARANKVVDRPLRKDFGVITQHLTEVTHRLAWQEYLIDAQRLLRAPKIDGAIREHYGPEVLKSLRDAIEDIAAGEVAAQNAFESGVNYVRTGATIAGLGWRLTTALLQPIGLTQSMSRIGARHVAAGLVEWLGDAAKMENTAHRIGEKSAMMRLRAKTMQREISEIRNVVAGKNSAIEASYFYLIQKLQLVADIPTWLGQYHKAVEAGSDEKEAVALADQAVLDAQGGGQIKDLAGIQRGGPMLKLFTNFYSFFNTTYNLTADAVGRTNFRSPMSVGFLAVDLLLLYTVPAVLGTLLKAALHSGDDGEDEKKLVRQLIADQLTYLFGTMVGLREISGALQTAAGLPGDYYQGPASVRVFSELAKLGKQANQGEVDEALLKAANNVAGILFHYPAGQIGATLDGIVTMADGKTTNPGALIVGSNKK